MRRPRVGDIVEVEWVDSERIDVGWARRKRYRSAAKAGFTYGTAGYWMGGGERTCVGLSISPGNSSLTQLMSIPTVAVIRVHVLRRATKSTRRALRG